MVCGPDRYQTTVEQNCPAPAAPVVNGEVKPKRALREVRRIFRSQLRDKEKTPHWVHVLCLRSHRLHRRPENFLWSLRPEDMTTSSAPRQNPRYLVPSRWGAFKTAPAPSRTWRLGLSRVLWHRAELTMLQQRWTDRWRRTDALQRYRRNERPLMQQGEALKVTSKSSMWLRRWIKKNSQCSSVEEKLE